MQALALMISEAAKTIFAHPPRTGGTTIQAWLSWTDPQGEREALGVSDQHSTFADYLRTFPELFIPPAYRLLMSVRNPFTRAVSLHHYLCTQGTIYGNVADLVTSLRFPPQSYMLNGLPEDHLKRVWVIRLERQKDDFLEWCKDAKFQPFGKGTEWLHRLSDRRGKEAEELTSEDVAAVRQVWKDDFLNFGYSFDPTKTNQLRERCECLLESTVKNKS